jgi:hypothetical protein
LKLKLQRNRSRGVPLFSSFKNKIKSADHPILLELILGGRSTSLWCHPLSQRQIKERIIKYNTSAL